MNARKPHVLRHLTDIELESRIAIAMRAELAPLSARLTALEGRAPPMPPASARQAPWYRKLFGIFSVFALVALCAPVHGQVYQYFSPNGDLAPPPTSTGLSQTIAAGAVTNSKLATMANGATKCNASGATASPQDCPPIALQNLMGSIISVYATATVNETLSGLPTIDGVTVPAGATVLLASQSTSSQDGIWQVASGAWSRPLNFPSGFVIAVNCSVVIQATHGTSNLGVNYLLTTSSAVTIDTSSQTWGRAGYALATSQENGPAGIVYLTADDSNTAAAVEINFTGDLGNGWCAMWDVGSNNGTLDLATDVSGNNNGNCLISDPGGHPDLTGSGIAPTVTGSGCSLGANSNDDSGSIVASGADTCTLTFNVSFTFEVPHCTVGGYSASVLPYISTAPTATAVIFKTQAAGTFAYLCM